MKKIGEQKSKTLEGMGPRTDRIADGKRNQEARHSTKRDVREWIALT